MTRRCDTCEFWERGDRGGADDEVHVDDRQGRCRRSPPRPTMGDWEYEILRHLTTISWRNANEHEQETEFRDWEEAVEAPVIWPITTASDWCGEWRVNTR